MSEPTLYEAAYIMNASMSEEEAQQLIGVLEAAVEEVGGEVLGTRDFRTRRLAYPIKGQTHGAYKLLYFYGTGEVVDHVLSEMSIRQEVLRARVFVANPDAIVGGLEPGDGTEPAEVTEEAEVVEAAEAEEAAVAEEAEEAAVEEPAAEAEEAADPVESDEAPSDEEAPETEE